MFDKYGAFLQNWPIGSIFIHQHWGFLCGKIVFANIIAKLLSWKKMDRGNSCVFPTLLPFYIHDSTDFRQMLGLVCSVLCFLYWINSRTYCGKQYLLYKNSFITCALLQVVHCWFVGILTQKVGGSEKPYVALFWHTLQLHLIWPSMVSISALNILMPNPSAKYFLQASSSNVNKVTIKKCHVEI